MNGIKNDPDIKSDPDSPPGSGYMDDDFYEDTGELQLPPKGSEKDVWLTRIPKWLYEGICKWEDLADGRDDDQIVIGEVLAFPDPARPGQASRTEPMRVFLHNRSLAEKHIPQAFELNMSPASSDVLGNTYIFTEKDLPGYKPSGFGSNKMGMSRYGAHNHNLGVQDPAAKVQKRSKYKKAIPKQTALIGSTTREYIANPLPTRDYLLFTKARTRHAIQGAEEKTNIVDNLNDHTLSLNVQKMFKTFIRPNLPTKSQLNKAARIPRNELVDLLHACFDEYMYWPMKALKARTRQPEAYLKDVLGDIAVLVRGGPFASHWKRNGVYDGRDLSNQLEQAAPEAGDGDEDAEEEMEMEDVL